MHNIISDIIFVSTKGGGNSVNTATAIMNTLSNNTSTNSASLWSKRMTGYGHWKITVKVTGSDQNGEEYDNKEIVHTTTNSRAIDGHDGGDRALVSECLNANDFDSANFDLSDISKGEDDEEEA